MTKVLKPIMKPTMTHAEAMDVFRALVRRYGIRWTPAVVPDAGPWEQLAEVNRVLTEDDRREALGLPRVRS
jgi:hypothetical protein